MSSDDFNETADLRATGSGLQIAELAPGDGAEATSGQNVTVHYTGWLTDGRKFDSSRDRGSAFTFKLGGGQVIRGWDEGVAGLRVGGRRRLEIPPELGYGSRGAGPIPGGATLIFAVELLSVS
jgi:FKBP-type peptidyl-prolyl cis-trans isomerase FkpA